MSEFLQINSTYKSEKNVRYLLVFAMLNIKFFDIVNSIFFKILPGSPNSRKCFLFISYRCVFFLIGDQNVRFQAFLWKSRSPRILLSSESHCEL